MLIGASNDVLLRCRGFFTLSSRMSIVRAEQNYSPLPPQGLHPPCRCIHGRSHKHAMSPYLELWRWLPVSARRMTRSFAMRRSPTCPILHRNALRPNSNRSIIIGAIFPDLHTRTTKKQSTSHGIGGRPAVARHSLPGGALAIQRILRRPPPLFVACSPFFNITNPSCPATKPNCSRRFHASTCASERGSTGRTMSDDSPQMAPPSQERARANVSAARRV